jgi:deoxyribonuclease V
MPSLVCVDVDYRETGAVAAALWFDAWDAESERARATAIFREIAEYEPGAFYKRELPCLLGVLALGDKADIAIVDGYVQLGAGKPGLGAHLHAAIGGIVIGVAKTRFASATDAVPLVRHGSTSPLFISSIGMPVQEAADLVRSMHGPYRIPTLLKAVDSLARMTTIPEC